MVFRLETAVGRDEVGIVNVECTGHVPFAKTGAWLVDLAAEARAGAGVHNLR